MLFSWRAGGGLEHLDWVELKSTGESLKAPQRQVLLASLESADVSSVNAKEMRKAFLA